MLALEDLVDEGVAVRAGLEGKVANPVAPLNLLLGTLLPLLVLFARDVLVVRLEAVTAEPVLATFTTTEREREREGEEKRGRGRGWEKERGRGWEKERGRGWEKEREKEG